MKEMKDKIDSNPKCLPILDGLNANQLDRITSLLDPQERINFLEKSLIDLKNPETRRATHSLLGKAYEESFFNNPFKDKEAGALILSSSVNSYIQAGFGNGSSEQLRKLIHLAQIASNVCLNVGYTDLFIKYFKLSIDVGRKYGGLLLSSLKPLTQEQIKEEREKSKRAGTIPYKT